MSTKTELIALFADGQLATGANFAALINSLKGVQTPVTDPTASGSAKTFIASITQNAEGKITVTKKSVDFSGLLTERALTTFQPGDVQVVGLLSVTATDARVTETVMHRKNHYPTVRLMGKDGVEVKSAAFVVTHLSVNELTITVAGDELDVNGFPYQYILD